MFTKTTIAAAVIALGTLAGAPAANANGLVIDFGGGGIFVDIDHQMSEWEVRHMLRDRGYHDIDFDDTDGRVYKLTAEKHGDDYFIKVDSYTGQIVHRHEI